MGNSHKNILLRNHWANCNQTFVEWSLDGPLPKLCPVIPTSNQDGHQAKNRKKGEWNLNSHWMVHFQKCVWRFGPSINFFFNFNTFRVIFKNYKRWMLSLNCKNVHPVEIYLPCNFEVNLITHLGVLAPFSSIFKKKLILFVLYFKNYKR